MVDYLREEYRHGLPPKVPGERSGTVASILSNSGPAGALGSEPPEELNYLDHFIWRRLWERYGTEPFPRGYIDQGRIKRLFGHQIIAVDDNYDPCSRDTRLRCLPYLSVPDVNGARYAQPVGMAPYEGIPRTGGIGESEAHRRLKAYVADHPEILGIPLWAPTVRIEYPLVSGDRVDVVFLDADQVVFVEVKPQQADVREQIRGVFQCIKYQAVAEAALRAHGRRQAVHCRLVLEGILLPTVPDICQQLDVTVLERITVPDGVSID